MHSIGCSVTLFDGTKSIVYAIRNDTYVVYTNRGFRYVRFEDVKELECPVVKAILADVVD